MSTLWPATVLILASFVVAGAPKGASPSPPERSTTEIPESARQLRNPVSSSDAVLRSGRALWRGHCEICHGTLGRGDGPNARLHEMRKSVAPRDLTEPDLQESLSDGEIFWRISNGIIDGDNIIMPAYASKIPSEVHRWQIVVFVRQLGKVAAAK